MKKTALIFLTILLAAVMTTALADSITCASDANVYDAGADGTVYVLDVLPAGTPYSVVSSFRPEAGTPYSNYFATNLGINQPLLYFVTYTLNGLSREGVMLEGDVQNQLLPGGNFGEPSNENTPVRPSNPGDSANSVEHGYVLCESLAVQMEPNTTSDAIASLSYGLTFSVTENNGDWCKVNCDGTIGWVSTPYVLINPSYYTTQNETAAYAYPAPEAPRVGLINPNTQLAIIAELTDYYCVSIRGASAFIKK